MISRAADMYAIEMQPETSVTVQLLGSFRVVTNRGPVSDAFWHGAKARALFKYLAYRAGTPVSKDTLMDVLWPGLDPDDCQNNLHKAVHMLRQSITMALGWNAKDVLEFSQSQYTLHADDITVDSAAFKSTVFEAKWAARLGQGDRARAMYETAVGLYSGDLLEDDFLTEWAGPERDRLRAEYAAALQWLVNSERAQSNVDSSAAYARRLLAVDPTNEEMYRYLIELALSDGRRGEALRLFRHYREATRQAGMLPSAELATLVEAANGLYLVPSQL